MRLSLKGLDYNRSCLNDIADRWRATRNLDQVDD
jgi:hypothetical protein